jgi:hypothetical protein
LAAAYTLSKNGVLTNFNAEVSENVTLRDRLISIKPDRDLPMTLKPGMLAPLIGIDVAVGVVGIALAFGWGKLVQGDADRDTTVFLCKMFGGISQFFL